MIKNESGRSMVEMLGVLAIIGVLSVGGIAGYTMAMKKYRTNEVINSISMAAVFCETGDSLDAVPDNYFANNGAPSCETADATKKGQVNFTVDENLVDKAAVGAALAQYGTVDSQDNPTNYRAVKAAN